MDGGGTRRMAKLTLALLLHVIIIAPHPSLAFQLQPFAKAFAPFPKSSIQLRTRKILTAANGFQRQPLDAKLHYGSSYRTRPSTSLKASSDSSSLSAKEVLQTVGLQLHKFAGLAWLLVFEGVVGIWLKFHGILLPPSVYLSYLWHCSQNLAPSETAPVLTF